MLFSYVNSTTVRVFLQIHVVTSVVDFIASGLVDLIE